MTALRSFEDFRVGETFRTGTYRVEAEEITSFARRYDPQPFHLDPALAADSLFGGLAASGWHTAAVTMRLIVTSGLRIAGGVVGRVVEELGWPRPVRAGDVLEAVGEVIEVLPSKTRPDRGTVRVRVETRNQAGEVVQTMTARLMVPRRVADDAGQPAAG